MKRTLGILLIACLLLGSLSGVAFAEQKTITFLTVGDPYVGAIKELLPEFEAKYNIHVVVDSVPFLDLHAKALLELAGDTGSYDLISVDMATLDTDPVQRALTLCAVC